jgi:hypothetical protein
MADSIGSGSPPSSSTTQQRRLQSIPTSYLIFCALAILTLLTLPKGLPIFLQERDGETVWTFAAPIAASPTSRSFDGIVNNKYPPRTQEYLDMSLDKNKTIRKWGCHRNETPLIFVHVGKAGGGMVRARFAGSALNYGHREWHTPEKDNHFYPVSAAHNASFCNSKNKNHRVPESNLWPKTFEGNAPCSATTPIGLALACPEASLERSKCLGCNDLTSEHCHTVYVGHNNMGSELHWLPPKYLEKWWQSTEWYTKMEELKDNHTPRFPFHQLTPKKKKWCRKQKKPRPDHGGDFAKVYDQCSVPLAAQFDDQFERFWSQQSSTNQPTIMNYSPIYASLPVHRATMLREPYSWLVSKFFWHSRDMERNPETNKQLRCWDIETASKSSLTNPGWAYLDVMHYIGYLCGDDCSIRLERGLLTLEELEAQTESNLRNAFSVVGLLNETNQFYDMVTKRIAYVDMALHPHVIGKVHTSKGTRMALKCKEMFANVTFQEEFKAQLPVLAVLDRLYKVGVEVNRFQREELRQCNSGSAP